MNFAEVIDWCPPKPIDRSHWSHPPIPEHLFQRVSPLVTERFEAELIGAPNSALMQFVVDCVRMGFDHGAILEEDGGFEKINSKSATATPAQTAAVDKFMDGELAANRLYLVPKGIHAHMRVLPVGTAPKGHDLVDPSWRITCNYSASGPNGQPSVNEATTKDHYSLQYAGLCEISAAIRSMPNPRNAQILQLDVMHAYRNLPTCRALAHTAVMRWRGQLLGDRCMGFGATSSCFNYNSVALVLKVAMYKALRAEFGSSESFIQAGSTERPGDRFAIVHLLDDVGVVVSNKEMAPRAFAIMKEVYAEFGMPLQLKKCMWGARTVWLGLEFDCPSQTVGLPADKRERYAARCLALRKCDSARLVRFQEVIGSMTYAHHVMRNCRPLVSSLLRATRGRTCKFRPIRLTELMKADLEMLALWATHKPAVALPVPREKPVYGVEGVPPPPFPWRASNSDRSEVLVFGDASGKDGFAFCSSELAGWRHWTEDDFIELTRAKLGKNASVTEAIAVLEDLHQWGDGNSSTLLETMAMVSATVEHIEHGLRNCRLVYIVDNQNVVTNLAKMRSSTWEINLVMRALMVPLETAGVTIEGRWRRRTRSEIVLADQLSHCPDPQDLQDAGVKTLRASLPDARFIVPHDLPLDVQYQRSGRQHSTTLRRHWRKVAVSNIIDL